MRDITTMSGRLVLNQQGKPDSNILIPGFKNNYNQGGKSKCLANASNGFSNRVSNGKIVTNSKTTR